MPKSYKAVYREVVDRNLMNPENVQVLHANNEALQAIIKAVQSLMSHPMPDMVRDTIIQANIGISFLEGVRVGAEMQQAQDSALGPFKSWSESDEEAPGAGD
jgi:hypothetical protein